jgi:hypothetical protein
MGMTETKGFTLSIPNCGTSASIKTDFTKVKYVLDSNLKGEMEVVDEYVLEQTIRVYTLCRQSHHHKYVKDDLEYGRWSEKMTWSVSMLAGLTFYESQAFIYNFFMENIDLVIAKIEQVDKDLKLTDKYDLYTFGLKLMEWLHPKDYDLTVGNLFREREYPGNYTTNENLKKNVKVTDFEKTIFTILNDVEADPIRFEEKLRKKWVTIVTIINNRQYDTSDFYHNFIRQIAENKDFDSINSLCCAIRLAVMLTDYFRILKRFTDFMTFKKDSVGSLLSSVFAIYHLGKLAWFANKVEWIRILTSFRLETDILNFCQDIPYSVDLLDALVETFGAKILFNKDTSYLPGEYRFEPRNFIETCFYKHDVEMMFYLLSYPLDPEETNEIAVLLSNKIDHHSDMTQIAGRPMMTLHTRRGSGVILPVKWDHHGDAILARIQVLGQFIERLPMLKMRIAHTRKLGGVSILEENGFRDFLDFEPFVPNWEFEDFLATNKSDDLPRNPGR